jgi:hypothetical protein
MGASARGNAGLRVPKAQVVARMELTPVFRRAMAGLSRGVGASAAPLHPGYAYYTAVSMGLDVFNVPLPEGAKPYFAQPK